MQDLLENLNEAQKQAVTHDKGPLLIVAGAGTGKTTVLTRRFVWLMQNKQCASENILAVTFTEKAAQEMEDRIIQMLPNGTYDFWIHTFHGLCQRILEEHALEIGLPNTFRIISESDAWILLKRHIDELPLDHYRPLGNPVKFLKSLLQHISRAKDEGILPDQYVEFAENAKLDGDSEIVSGERKRLKELADIYAAYQKILRDEGVLDFGDLIVETLRLFKERPAVMNKYRKQFTYLLVDEFQDTNWAQYELIKLLSEPEQNITVVGDDDQAIYKFRGASLANILQFKDDYPKAATVALTKNYRSHQEILDTAYELITKNNPHRLEITLQDQVGTKQLQAIQGDGAEVDVEWFGSVEREAEWVANDIKARHVGDITWSDMAILVRSNDEALVFIQALERLGVPYRFFALRGLYTKPVVVDIIALLNAASNPMDNPAMWRVINMECFAIPLKGIADTVAYANRKGYSLWESSQAVRPFLNEQPDAAQKIEQLSSIIERLAETARRDPPLAVLHAVLQEAGYLNHLMGLPERERVESIQLLNEFVSRIRRYELSANAPNLKEFMDELQLEIESGEQGALHGDAESGPDLVRIMTIHASKGLEFKTVYLVSMVDQRFPTRRRSEAIPLPDGLVQERLQEGDVHLQEERRLCYVAMTRAKQRLVLTGALDYGGARQKKPSCFITESGLEVCDPVTEAADTANLTAAKQAVQDQVSSWRDVFELKRRFSFTQLVAYKKCPLQYKFAHIYHIPVLGAFQKSFGQSIHLALQYILKRHMDRSGAEQGSLFEAPTQHPKTAGGLLVTQDEAIELFKSAWIDEWYPTRHEHDRHYKDGLQIIKQLWKDWSEHPPKVKALESGFDWRIGEHSIKGKIDRIDELDGGIAIVDYKTSDYKEDQRAEPADREQLQLYQLAMEARGYTVKRMCYHYVRPNSFQEIPLLEGDAKDKFIETMERRMNEILISEFPATPSSFLCKYCDYKNICEYRK